MSKTIFVYNISLALVPFPDFWIQIVSLFEEREQNNNYKIGLHDIYFKIKIIINNTFDKNNDQQQKNKHMCVLKINALTYQHFSSHL